MQFPRSFSCALKTGKPGFYLGLLLFFAAFSLTTLSYIYSPSNDHKAYAATSSTINFQARLLNSAGNVVPDGNYHIEFKIYDSLASGASAQGVCSLDSSSDDCWWRETRTTGNLVRVVNGYFTVNLGSVTSFGANIPWDQELWLTMNIGGTSGPSWDGEMSPRMKLTAVPYALTAGKLQATSGANTGSLVLASFGQDSVITVPDPGGASDTVCLQGLANCGGGGGGETLQQTYGLDADGSDSRIDLTSADDSIIISNPDSGGSDSTYVITIEQLEDDTGTKGGLSIQSAGTGNLLLITDTTATAADVLTIANGGATTFRNQTNSTAAFRIQNAAGSTLLNLDTTTSVITQSTFGPSYLGGANSNGSANTGNTNSGFSQIAVNGRYTYVAKAGNATACSQSAGSAQGCEFQVYDTTIPGIPTYLGGVDISGSSTGTSNVSFNGIAQTGKYAYLTKDGDATACSQTAGSAIGCELQVYDISNPAVPTYVGGVDATSSTNSGTGNKNFHKVTLAGRYAYVVTATDNTGATCSATPGTALGCELQIYDISNPVIPVYIGGLDANGTTNGGTANRSFNSSAISGKYLYITSNGQATACSATPGSAEGCEFKVVDISNPSAPSYVAGVDTNGSATGTGSLAINFVSVGSQVAYIAKDGDATACSQSAGSAIGCEFMAIDISNPLAPAYAGGMDVSGSATGTGNRRANAVAISGKYAYLALNADATACSQSAGSAIGCEVQVYNVSSPSSLTYLGGADISGASNSGSVATSAISVVISGRTLYVAGGGDSTPCSATPGSGEGCELQMYEPSGIEAVSVLANSLEAGTLTVQNDAEFTGTIQVNGSINVSQSASVQGNFTNSGSALFKNSSNSTTAFQIQNSAGTTTLFNADTTNTKLVIGGDIVANASATGTTGTTTGTGTSTTTLTLTSDPFSVGDVVLIDNAGQDYYTRITVDPGTNSYTVSPAVTFETGRTVTKYNIQNIGATITDYTTQSNRFFQGYFVGGIVVGAGSTTYSDGHIASSTDLSIRSGGNVVLGTSDTTGTLLVLDIKTDSGDPTGTEGAIYYNDNSNTFRCYQNTAWTDCIGAGGSTDLQGAYDNSSSPATITTSSAAKGIVIASGVGFDSDNLLRIQNSSGTDILNVDSANTILTVGGNIKPANAAVNQVTNAVHNVVDNSGTVSPYYSSLAIGSDGLPVIAYSNFTDLLVAKCADRECSANTIITTVDAGPGGGGASIAIGADGLPIISYTEEFSEDLLVVKCGNLTCSANNTSTTVYSTGSVGWETRIAIGSDNLPVISWVDFDTNDLWVTKCGNAACSSGNTTTTVASAENIYYSNINIGSDGLPVLAYADDDTSFMHFIKCGNAACTAGNVNTLFDENGDTDDYPSIAISNDGLPILAYSEFGDGNIIVTKCGNLTCSANNTRTVVDPADSNFGNAYQADIKIGKDGLPIIAAKGNYNGGNLWMIKCGNSVCSSNNSITAMPSDGSGDAASLEIGTDGLPIVSHQNAGDQNLIVTKCSNLACGGGHAVSVLGQYSTSGDSVTSIAKGADGFPVISYYDGGADDNLRVVKCGDTECLTVDSDTLVASLGNVGQYNSIAVPADGLPVISYYGGSLEVTKCGDPGCTQNNTTTTVNSGADLGRWSSIAIGSDGLPVISYYDFTNGDLKVAKCGDPACSSGNTITSVDTTNTVGYYTDIAIGTDGFPVISHFDVTNSDLRITKCGNLACSSGNTTTAVDTTGNIGAYPSIDVPSDGLPAISYTDSDNGALKFVKCGNASCSSGNSITTVDNDTGTIGFQNTLIIGGDDLPVMAYYEGAGSTYDLKITKCGNATCDSGNITTVADGPNDVNQQERASSMTLGSDGYPVISYTFNTDELNIFKCSNHTCSGQGEVMVGGTQLGSNATAFQNVYTNNLHSGNNSPLSILAGGVEKLRVGAGVEGVTVFGDSDTAFRVQNSLGQGLFSVDAKNQRIEQVSTAFSGNLLPTAISTYQNTSQIDTEFIDADAVGEDSSIAIGTDGLPIISYQNSSSDQLQIAHCADKACTALDANTEFSVSGSVGNDTSIAVGADGLPIVSHYNSDTGNLRVSHCANIKCTSLDADTEFLDSDIAGQATSIAIGKDGLPIISHYNATNGNLQITHCANIKCTSFTNDTEISDADDVGWGSSIKIGTDGIPIISSYNETGTNLQISKCANISCTALSNDTEFTDSDSVGDNSSLAIGTDGLPIISSLNNTNQNLQVSKCADTGCTTLASSTEFTDSDSTGNYSSINIGTDGLPIISHYNATNGNLQISHCEDINCTSFSEDTEMPNSDDVGLFTSMIIGTDGLPIISYANDTNTNLQVTRCGNTTCSSGNPIADVGTSDDEGYTSSIAIGEDGLPVIANFDATNGDLRVVKCGNKTCGSGNTSTAVDTTGNVGEFTSIAVPSDGFPVISYYDFTNTNLKMTKCGNASCTSGNTSTTVDNSANDVGEYNSIAIGDDGLPIISYWDDTTNDLKVAKCGNSTCSSGNTITTVDSTGSPGTYSSIAMPSDGLAVIAHVDFSAGTLKMTKCGNTACSSGNTNTVVDSSGNVEALTSIAIGADGLPIISYTDQNNDYDLWVAKCGNATCSSGNTLTEVDEGPEIIGNNSDITIGADGLPIISYTEETNDKLRILHCGNIACSSGNKMTVAANSYFAGFSQTSIDIGSDGLPIISYYDGDVDDDLKVLHCGTVDCTGITQAQLGGIDLGSISTPFQNGYINNLRAAGTGEAINVDSLQAMTPGSRQINTEVSQIEGGSLYYQPSIALGNDGFPRLASSYFTGTGDFEIYYTQCEDAICDDSDNELLTSNGYSARNPIAIGSDGFARIAYDTLTGGGFAFVRCTNDSCSTRNTNTVDSGTTVGGGGIDMSLASDGFGRISYYDYGSSALKFARCTNADCSSANVSTVDNTEDDGTYSVLTIGSDGFARILYTDYTNWAIKFARCTNADCSASNKTTIADVTSLSNGFSIYMSADGFARLAYSADNEFHFVQCTNADCTTSNNTPVYGNYFGGQNAMEMGADGYARIAYERQGIGLRYMKCLNEACTSSNEYTVDSTVNNSYQEASLTLDSNGYARIAYNSNGYLKIATLSSDTGQDLISGSLLGLPDAAFGQANLKAINLQGELYIDNIGRSTSPAITVQGGTSYFRVVDDDPDTILVNIDQSEFRYMSKNENIFFNLNDSTGGSLGISGNESSDVALTIANYGEGNGLYVIANGEDSAAATFVNFNSDGEGVDVTIAGTGSEQILGLSNGDGELLSFDATASLTIQQASGADIINLNGNNASHNVLVNSGFESGTDFWSGYGAAGVTRDWDHSYAGAASGRIDTSAATDDGVKYNYTFAENSYYTLSAMFKVLPGQSVFDLEMGYSNDGSTDSACEYPYIYNSPGQQGWMKYTCSFITSSISGTPYIYIKQTDSNAQSFYIDNVSLVRDSLLANPSGEGAVAGNWIAKGGSTISQDSTYFYDYANSVKIGTSAAANDGVKQNITLNPSTAYDLSFYLITDPGSLNFSGIDAGYSNDGSTDTSCSATPNTGSSMPYNWTQYRCTIQTPNGYSGTPYIFIHKTSSNAQDFYIDQVTLTPQHRITAATEGQISINAVITSPLVIQNQTDSTQSISVKKADGTNLLNVDTLTGQIQFGASVSIQSDNSSAFRVQDADGDSYLNVDTISRTITIADLDAIYNYNISTDFGSYLKANNIEDGSSAGFPSIAQGSDGSTHISYYESGIVYAKCADYNCESYSEQTTVDNGILALNNTLEIGSDGFARIAYWDTTDGDLEFAQCTNVSCSTNVKTTVDSTGSVGEAPSMAIGNDGYARITYSDTTNNDFKFVQCTNADCSTNVKTVIDSGVSGWTASSIKIASDGFARIAYADSNGGGVNYVQCTNASCSTNNNNAVDATLSYHPVLQIGSDGFGRISYANYNSYPSNYDIMFAQCTNASCSTMNTNTIEGTQSYITNSMVLGSDGFAKIAYNYIEFDETGNPTAYLTFAQCEDASCSSIQWAEDSIKYSNLNIVPREDRAIVDGADFMRVLYGGNYVTSMAVVGPTGFGGVEEGVSLGKNEEFAGVYTGLVQTSYFLQRSKINTTKAFQIQNSAGTSLMTVDTLNNQVVLAKSVFSGNILPANAPTYQATTTVNQAIDSDGNVGSEPTVAIGTDGYPVIAYIDTTNDALKITKCGDSDCTSGNVTNSFDSGLNSDSPSIAIAPDGNPIIAYYVTSGGNLRVSKCANVSCTSFVSSTDVDTSGNIGKEPTIAIGLDGFAVISHWDDTNDALKVSKCTNTNCTSATNSTVDNTATDTGNPNSIAIGTDGLPIISYYDNTGNLDLKVAKCNDTACTGGDETITTIESTGNIGAYNDIAIGSDGLPVIVFYDTTNTAAKLLRCANTSCTSALSSVDIDPAGPATAGQHITVAIGLDGLPFVAYKDSTNGYLRVTKCGNLNCSSGNTSTNADTSGGIIADFSDVAILPDGRPYVAYYDNNTDNLKGSLSAAPSGATSGNIAIGGLDIGSSNTPFQSAYVNNIRAGNNSALSLGAGGSDRLIISTDGTVSIQGTAGSSIFQVKNLSVNFGAYAETGAFVERNSYFNDEFNIVRTNPSVDTAGSAENTFGDSGGWGTYEQAAGECEFTNPADVVNGVAQIAANAAANECLIMVDDAINNARLMLDADFLPVMLFKVKPSQADATSGLYVGMSDSTDALASTAPNSFIGFSNDNAGTLGTVWKGITRNGGTSTTIDCVDTVSTTQFALLKVEVVTTTDVRFYIDADVSNGVSWRYCGTSATNVPTAGLAPQIHWQERTGGAASNLQVDFYRVWQDDNQPQSEDGQQPEQNVVQSPSVNPQDQIGIIDFNEATTADIVFDNNVYIKGKLFVNEIVANKITGLEVVTDQISSLQNQLSALLTAQQQALYQGVTNNNQTANSLQGNIAVGGDLSISGNLLANQLAVSGIAVFNNGINVNGTANLQNIVVNGHIISGGELPTIDVLTAAGLTTPPEGSQGVVLASSTVNGNDTSGVLTIILGQNTTSGELIKLKFNKVFTSVPKVVITAANDKAGQSRYYVGETTIESFKLIIIDSHQAGDQLKFNYIILQ